jgi:hypothetical protein
MIIGNVIHHVQVYHIASYVYITIQFLISICFQLNVGKLKKKKIEAK